MEGVPRQQICFADLPPEILDEILKNLDFHNLKNARTVCQDWLSSSNRLLSNRVISTVNSNFLAEFYYLVKAGSKSGMDGLLLQDVQLNLDLESIDEMRQYLANLWYFNSQICVRRLRINQNLSSDGYCGLHGGLPNYLLAQSSHTLTQLTLISVSWRTAYELQQIFNLPNLLDLSIDMMENDESFNEELSLPVSIDLPRLKMFTLTECRVELFGLNYIKDLANETFSMNVPVNLPQLETLVLFGNVQDFSELICRLPDSKVPPIKKFELGGRFLTVPGLLKFVSKIKFTVEELQIQGYFPCDFTSVKPPTEFPCFDHLVSLKMECSLNVGTAQAILRQTPNVRRLILAKVSLETVAEILERNPGDPMCFPLVQAVSFGRLDAGFSEANSNFMTQSILDLFPSAKAWEFRSDDWTSNLALKSLWQLTISHAKEQECQVRDLACFVSKNFPYRHMPGVRRLKILNRFSVKESFSPQMLDLANLPDLESIRFYWVKNLLNGSNVFAEGTSDSLYV